MAQVPHFCCSERQKLSGPLPMQLVVPSAVRAAVAAATTMRSSTSQIVLCFMVVCCVEMFVVQSRQGPEPLPVV